MKMLKKISKRSFLKEDLKNMEEIYFVQKQGKDLSILRMVNDIHDMIFSFPDEVPFNLKKDIHFDPADLTYNIADDMRRKCCQFKGDTYAVEMEMESEKDLKSEFYLQCKAINKRRIPIYVLNCKELHMGGCNFFDQIDRPFILAIEK